MIKHTQSDQVLAYLREHGSITSYRAWTELGIAQLPRRIFDLRNAGYDVQGEAKIVTNRRGERVRITEYRLEEV